MNREAQNIAVVESLLPLINMYKMVKDNPGTNYKYLINSIIRYYIVKEENIHCSEAFLETWKSITDKEVYGFFQERITCKYDNVNVRKFKGSSNAYTDVVLNKGDKITWNKVFHYEHVTTVHDTMNALLEVENLTVEKAIEILDTIHICRITKEEDKRINNLGGCKNHREGSYEDIVKNVYERAGIKFVK